ncbi:MAG: hypothetical protein JSW26_16775 [Desulfobacterales bacterium]|nr:MAG: hypothetical protein JSW26_16775 [Desulfobacterales bacterium]
MRHYSIHITFFFLFISIGCASRNNANQVDSDYEILLKEQIQAHRNAGFNPPFQQVIEDYRTFKRQLYSEIKEKYVSQFRKDEFNQIEKILLGLTPKRRNRLDVGADVFHRFQGRWRGKWIQNRKTIVYDQIWFSPYEIEGGLIAQKVIIRQWDDRNEKPANAIAAINTYNPKNNMILGAVDVERSKRKNTHAPHLGFRIDPSTFIWIACFATNSKNPSYSFFFEKVSTIDQVKHYKIRGVGFNWNRKSKKLANINWREGHYVQVRTAASPSYAPYFLSIHKPPASFKFEPTKYAPAGPDTTFSNLIPIGRGGL